MSGPQKARRPLGVAAPPPGADRERSDWSAGPEAGDDAGRRGEGSKP